MKRILLALAVVLAQSVAHAETPPSVWQRAAKPSVGEAYDLHIAVQQKLHPPFLIEDDDGQAFSADARRMYLLTLQASQRDALRILDEAKVEQGDSALLRFDLGTVLVGLAQSDESQRNVRTPTAASRRYWERARDVLKRALADFPNAQNVEHAWHDLVDACGHIGDNRCEDEAYAAILRSESEEVGRLTPTANFAETRMHMGDLKGAIELYREAFRMSGHFPTGRDAPLAVWGMAVAYDRLGESVEAEKQATFAVELETSIQRRERLLTGEGVFFVPDYEVFWYRGLEQIAIAKTEPPRNAIIRLRAAQLLFDTYVKDGTAKNDRWVPMAKRRAEQVKKERARLGDTGGPLPPVPVEKDIAL